ncbi:MAG TPA: hypothetical protein VFF27_10205 [Bacteroidia bacterium]|jgi:hypothetical protein|nr:hypothetical protein [Bacteroidia bacterium]
MINISKRSFTEPLSVRKFVELKGLKDYRGIKGFDNLMLLLKEDIKSLFNEHSTKKSSNKRVCANSIRDILAPYQENWEEWTASNFCSLTELEIRTVNYYTKYHTHKQLSAEYNLPYNLVYSHFRNAIRTLKAAATIAKFNDWTNAKTQTPEQQLLDSPIVGMRSLMSTRLCFALARIETTFRELLENHSVHDLLQYRGIGLNSIDELKMILRNHNCLFLLREK